MKGNEGRITGPFMKIAKPPRKQLMEPRIIFKGNKGVILQRMRGWSFRFVQYRVYPDNCDFGHELLQM